MRIASVRAAVPSEMPGSRFRRAVEDPAVDELQEQGGEDAADDLGDDVARDPHPGEVAADREGERDRRVEVGARDRAHEEDDAHDHHARGEGLHGEGQVAADRQRPDHAAARGDEHEQERAPHLAEQAPELEARVVEIGLALS